MHQIGGRPYRNAAAAEYSREECRAGFFRAAWNWRCGTTDLWGPTMNLRVISPAALTVAAVLLGASTSSAATGGRAFTHPAAAVPATAVSPWALIRPLPAPRAYPAAVTVGKTIYVGGGVSAGFTDQATFWAYSPATNTYTAKAPMPHTIGRPVFEGSGGQVYAFGTNYAGGDDAFFAFRYAPASNTWRALPPLADPSTDNFSWYGVGASGRIYAIDGLSATGSTPSEVYTPATNVWTLLSATPSLDSTVPTNRAQNWNPATGVFTPLPSTTNTEPPVRCCDTPIVGPDGRYYSIGGCDGPDEGDMECYPMRLARVLVPSTHRWGVSSDAPDGTGVADWSTGINNPAVALAGGKIYVFGGEDDFLSFAVDEAATFTPSDTTLPVVTQAPLAQPAAQGGITLTFAGSDANGLSDMQLQRRTNGGAWSDVPEQYPYVVTNGGWFFFNGTFTQLGARAGDTYQYRVLASDSFGNTSAFKVGPSWKAPLLHQDGEASYSGAWTVTHATGDSGGSLHQTTHAGSAAVFTFTGKGIALLSPGCAGSVKVVVDGVSHGTVTEAGGAAASDVVWGLGFPTSGSHSLRLVAANNLKTCVDAFKVIG